MTEVFKPGELVTLNPGREHERRGVVLDEGGEGFEDCWRVYDLRGFQANWNKTRTTPADWVVAPGMVQLPEPPEGAQWRLVPDNSHRKMMDESAIIATTDLGSNLTTGYLSGYRELNPEPVPETKPGQPDTWIWLTGYACFVERVTAGELTIWFESGDHWRHEGYRPEPMETLQACDPPENAGELLALLSATEDACAHESWERRGLLNSCTDCDHRWLVSAEGETT